MRRYNEKEFVMELVRQLAVEMKVNLDSKEQEQIVDSLMDSLRNGKQGDQEITLDDVKDEKFLKKAIVTLMIATTMDKLQLDPEIEKLRREKGFGKDMSMDEMMKKLSPEEKKKMDELADKIFKEIKEQMENIGILSLMFPTPTPKPTGKSEVEDDDENEAQDEARARKAEAERYIYLFCMDPHNPGSNIATVTVALINYLIPNRDYMDAGQGLAPINQQAQLVSSFGATLNPTVAENMMEQGSLVATNLIDAVDQTLRNRPVLTAGSD